MAICSGYKNTRVCKGVWINRITLESAFGLWLGSHITEWANARDRINDVSSERGRLLKELETAQNEEQKFEIGHGRSNSSRVVWRMRTTTGA
jgi:hypothetical protein